LQRNVGNNKAFVETYTALLFSETMQALLTPQGSEP